MHNKWPSINLSHTNMERGHINTSGPNRAQVDPVGHK